MQSEEERVRRIMQDMAQGKPVGEKLVYVTGEKKIRPASPTDDPDRTVKITRQDMDVFTTFGGQTL